ncbi:lysine transporter LysE [Sporosarcina sp. P21c]|uniref:LysE/ArgO family amino acid transporter n=1 Tax=unclassified Sporosarcina TaxID=2647733 RepID=UPI000C166432|nr:MULTISPECIES: LysE family transporter [unclassified Sporosarcina]PIC66163.1 lysine transporter LysE [Sporosarcina sp. P16a]PIC88804.1 lysine transporter LysE [Sporosarcina sp. P21c]PIC91827.1 lysine transporter LysE [Sporosarcina sp. P25]
MEATIHGIILAFGLILPLGIQNVFVFSQGATQPRVLQALPATITAALCDTFLIVLAVFGLSAIVLQFEWLRFSLVLVGVLFLLYMGLSIWNTKLKANESNNALPIRQQIMFALSVSLLNPHAILDTIGVIGTSALKYVGKEQVYFTIGCIAVAWAWFFGLMIAGSILKKLDTRGSLMGIINKFSALFIWGTAIYLLVGLM